MELYELMNRSDRLSKKWIDDLFDFSLANESTGESRRQLGYLDGYEGCEVGSQNRDYLRGWEQGRSMKSFAMQVEAIDGDQS